MARTAGGDAGEPAPEGARMEAADREERERLRAMTPGERVAEAIELSRVATRLAASARDLRP
jgi:hypothetical protein